MENRTKTLAPRVFVVILLLFALTLILRGYAIVNAPFDKGYFSDTLGNFTNIECSIHNRFIAQVWDEYPASVHHYNLAIRHGSPRMTANRYVGDAFDTYTSFPPAAFLVPYFLGKLFGVTLDFYDRWMQVFSLSLNLLCAVLIYSLARQLITPHRPEDAPRADRAALLCVALYLFNPNVLHYTSNVYWAHQFYEPFLLLLLLWLLRTADAPRRLPVVFAWAFGLSLITWTGLATCGGWFLFTLFLDRKQKGMPKQLAAIAGGAAAALATNVLWISSTIEGGVVTMFHNILAALSERTVSSVDPLFTVYALFKPAAWEFLPTLLLLLLCAGMLLAAKKGRRLAPVSKPELLVLGVSFVTCCESLPLMGHDGTYGFGRYKYIVFLLVVLMLLGKRWLACGSDGKKTRIVFGTALPLVFVCNIVHYLMVYSTNFASYTS